ncbi:hypothetical protein, partial [Neisseria meningitidis]|uniref:hypothetical protein n=1 Tax=Neisseria meningitidis TaxID=487 RepID=UPI0012AD1E2E
SFPPLFVIPTKVGIQNVKSQETVLSDKFPCGQVWIPACAGMTMESLRLSRIILIPLFCYSSEGGEPVFGVWFFR